MRTQFPQLTRRDLLQVGSISISASVCAGLGIDAQAEPARQVKGKARSVIFLWMGGGVTHIDSFDPKPKAPEEIRGELTAIDTSLPGVQFCETMPHLARIAHELAVVRSFSHDSNDHLLSQVYTLSGRKVNRTQLFSEPNLGSSTFVMGTDDRFAASGVAPAHKVTIGQPFYMGKTEVTNGQYRRFIQVRPDYDGDADVDPAYDLYLLHFKDKSAMSPEDEYPVVWVGWHNAMAFCAWAGLELSSEAQWEYACRAGTTTAYSFGDDEQNLHDYAWADLAAEHLTHPVATKLPNRWGLYDMHGNVWEWCADDYIYRYENAPSDGSVRRDPEAQTKPLRGGSWSTGPGVHRKTPDWFPSTAMGSVARFHVAPGNA